VRRQLYLGGRVRFCPDSGVRGEKTEKYWETAGFANLVVKIFV
jgi:hypothetical protein